MQAANVMLYKVVLQKTGSFNILCGFNPKLVFATAERVTSAVHTLTSEEARAIAVEHALFLNAEGVQDVTANNVLKKLAKNDEGSIPASVAGTFAAMGIASYL